MNEEAQPKAKTPPKRKSLIARFKNWCLQYLEIAPPKEFIDWSPDSPHDKEAISLKAFKVDLIKRDRNADAIRRKFIEKIKEISSNKTIRLDLDENIQTKPRFLDFVFENDHILKSKVTFELIRVKDSVPLFIKGASIGNIKISDRAKLINFQFEDCFIYSLEVENHKSIDLFLKDSIVGTLVLNGASVNNLTIQSSWICCIECPPTYEINPFVGSVVFDDAKFPTSTKHSKLFKGAQQYRNLRAHLLALQNAPAANLMHAKELASERETEKGLSWIFNWFYYLASNYGSRPAQPLLGILIFYTLLVFFNVCMDSGVANIPEGFQGWQNSLKGSGVSSDIYRSLILPLQSMINPFGLFWTKTLIIPKTFGGQLVNSITGLLNDALLIFTITALRKRFKLSAKAIPKHKHLQRFLVAFHSSE